MDKDKRGKLLALYFALSQGMFGGVTPIHTNKKRPSAGMGINTDLYSKEDQQRRNPKQLLQICS